MEDFIIMAGAEAVAIFGFWPRLAGRSEGWHNEALLEDNPHLRICLRTKQWTMPIVFILLFLGGIALASKYKMDLAEVTFLNLALLLISLLMGYGISEAIVDRYRNGGHRYRRKLTSAA